jgi:hypothetical protein
VRDSQSVLHDSTALLTATSLQFRTQKSEKLACDFYTVCHRHFAGLIARQPHSRKRGSVRITVTFRHVRVTILPWKSNKHYISVCVCVSVAFCYLQRKTLSSVACPAVPIFSALSHKRYAARFS